MCEGKGELNEKRKDCKQIEIEREGKRGNRGTLYFKFKDLDTVR